MITCPDRHKLHQFQDAQLPTAETLEIERHVESCLYCQQTLDVLPGAAVEFRALLRGPAPSTLDQPERAPSPPMTVTLPDVPGYEVLAELGQGGMGVVYKARHLSLDRLVALKMIRAGAQAGHSERARLLTEARAVAQLQHPSIIQIHEVGEYEGQLYLALEYVEGGSLHARLRGLPLPAQQAARLVEVLARAVQAAHGRGIIHRDLKPANVLLAPSDRPEAVTLGDAAEPAARFEPKIADFGLAKRLVGDNGPTHSGAIQGTPSYMAPEQAEGKRSEVGPPTDIYALGAILYELLTGRPPFRGDSALTTLHHVVNHEPLPPRDLQPSVPADLEAICLTCLRKQPAQRYASAAELSDELRRFQEGGRISGGTRATRPRLRHWARRHRLAAALSVAVVFLLAAGAGVGSYLALRSPVEELPAAPGAMPLAGDLIVRVWSRTDDGEKRGRRLEEFGALPVYNQERLRIEARLNQPASVYLLWVDSEGVVTPLYPWNNQDRIVHKDLSFRPLELPPRNSVASPGVGDRGWRVLGKSGLDTILLLARRQPLAADLALADLVGKLPATKLNNGQELVLRGFDEGKASVQLSRNRAPADQAAEIDDALLKLMTRLGPHFEVIRAVQFAHQER